MKINLSFILFEELRDKPDGSTAEAHIVMLRESKDLDFALDSAATDFNAPE
jgi:hypothetical protein